MSTDVALVLFRRDLRLADHPALVAGARHAVLLPVYVVEDDDPRPPGGASRWWLGRSLASLAAGLERRDQALVIRRGDLLSEVLSLVDAAGARAVYWNRRYDLFGESVDTRLKATLRERGLIAESFNGALLREPWDVQTKTKTPYAVFTAFARAYAALGPPPTPLAVPKLPAPPKRTPKSLHLEDLGLALDLPKGNPWHAGLTRVWTPGEAGARQDLDRFLASSLDAYAKVRDIPAETFGTSRLSPRLAFGELSPRQIWHATRAALGGRAPREGSGAAVFIKEVTWREFAYHLLHYNPTMPDAPLNERFAHFPWEDRKDWVKAWRRGQTGYPIVDAGMRELWATGTMHNRVRMIVASFLVKHLLTPWQVGAAWFQETLVDFDLASNSQNWQWCAGSGVDAAPYFRIFNPMLQGARFDPKGLYVRRWVPEVASLSDKHVHQPWEAASPAPGYPAPIVDHGAARTAALVRYERMKRETAKPSS